MKKNVFLENFEMYVDKFLSEQNLDSPLVDAMRYSVVDGGKRIRPLAVFYGSQIINSDLNDEIVYSLALAIELIHSYSLVHDDLPAMDNDDYRRGKLSTFKKYGEANGILIGDMLLNQSAMLLMQKAQEFGKYYSRSAYELLYAGSKMVDGQVYDLKGMKTAEDYLRMYHLKTGALFEGAFRAGAIAVGVDELKLQQITKFAEHLGLAFQIADDLLDEGETNSLVAVIGIDKAKELLESQTQKAIKLTENFKNGEELKEFSKLLAVRKK